MLIRAKMGTSLWYHDHGIPEPVKSPYRSVSHNEIMFAFDASSLPSLVNVKMFVHVITRDGRLGYVNPLDVEVIT
jgi:hypothetical protein